MEYTITQVRNVLRNYQSILSKKKSVPGENVAPKQTGGSDQVHISKEAMEKLRESTASDKPRHP